jgi:broad specificity phosphatase PhoE
VSRPYSERPHEQSLNSAGSYVSPRQRAKRTLELLGLGCRAALPWQTQRAADPVRCEATVQVTAAVREWDYGDYEGLTSAEIRAQRAAEGLPGRWDIWAEGCPGGE